MRIRTLRAMTLKVAVGVAAGILGVAGGLAPAPAVAATPGCGPRCIQVFSAKYGTAADPVFVETVYQGAAMVGVPTVMAAPSTSDPSGDIIVSAAGPVSTFYAAGMVSADVNAHYGSMDAVQLEYAPAGVTTGLCSGLASAPYQNAGLTLQPCDTPGSTVFIIDTADSPATAPRYFPIIMGNTTDFEHPFAMTLHGNPAEKRVAQIKIQRLRGNPDNVRPSQLWGANVFN
jgi:hypothetical protein